MLKKFFSYKIFLKIVILFIFAVGFAGLLRHHYICEQSANTCKDGGKFKSLRIIASTIAEIPKTVKLMYQRGTINLNKIDDISRHKDKKRFVQFIAKERDALLVIPRYDPSLNYSVTDIIDLKNFELIHTYRHDISAMNKKVTRKDLFPRINIDSSSNRFRYFSPLILENGSLIADSTLSPLFKIDFCSNLEWLNEEEPFHHSKMLDHEGNMWVTGGGDLYQTSDYVKKYNIRGFWDNLIMKVNPETGKIIYTKSIIEILIENKIFPENYPITTAKWGQLNPIHVNDVEPALSDSQHWKKGDIFISIRNQNAIIHYRPTNDRVINYIVGPFYEQHDVNIISEKEISIFNNNNNYIDNKFSEIIVYNFETKQFKKLFNDQLKKENFKTVTSGKSHLFEDGSLLVEEMMYGRIILLNSNGEKEWEYINKDKNGNIGLLYWSRVIEDKLMVEKLKFLIKNKKC